MLLPWLRNVWPSLGAIGNDIALPDVRRWPTPAPRCALHSQTRMWADVRQHLDRIDQPLLIFRSQQDNVVDPLSLKLVEERVRSTDFSVVPLERSYHVATLDYEAEQIFAGSASLLPATGEGLRAVARPMTTTARPSTAPSPIWWPATT